MSEKQEIVAKAKNRGTTIAIAIIGVLLVVAIAVGTTLAYFAGNATATGQITLGDPVNIVITQGGSSVSTLTFPGNALPGTTYDQPIGVSQPTSTSDALLRAKLTITNTDGATANVDATTTTSWQAGDDDYYYYKGISKAGDSNNFVTQIKVPTSLTNVDANKTFSIAIVVEALQQANQAALEVWDTAPEDWLTAYATA